MQIDLTENQIDALWDKGYRCYEIYTFNEVPVMYCGKVCPAGTIGGWDIKFVFSTRQKLNSFPFFDAIIGVDVVYSAESVWHGKESDQ
jgi:hypothetical protein